MHEASCLCGKVRIEIETLPATVTDCNCSICRRYGALWGYYRRDQVRLKADPDGRFVINARMLPLATLQSLKVRRLDGADSWEFLD